MKNASTLVGATVKANDGDIGKVHDLLFDSLEWKTRYIVVDTGKWLPDRRVLLSPAAVKSNDGKKRELAVDLTKTQVKNSPPSDRDLPVSRQHEIELHQHYGWPAYWVGLSAPVAGWVPEATTPEATEHEVHEDPDPHLRSTNEVSGYAIEAVDGRIGHVEDLLMPDQSWEIEKVLVDTRNWLPGKKVAIGPELIEDVDWGEKAVHVRLTKKHIKDRPEFVA